MFSYNMFGFKNGLSVLHDLCDSHSIIAVQEHWLREDELDTFNLVHTDYNYQAASGMNSAVSKSLLRSRPFSGVAFLWHKSLNGFIQYIGCSSDGRCIVIKLTMHNIELLIFNVYFPCFNHSIEYRDELCSLTGYIDNIINCNSCNEIVILGDTNFDIIVGHPGYDILNSLLCTLNMSPCDDLVNNGVKTDTYVNEALHSSSRIDHVSGIKATLQNTTIDHVTICTPLNIITCIHNIITCIHSVPSSAHQPITEQLLTSTTLV